MKRIQFQFIINILLASAGLLWLVSCRPDLPVPDAGQVSLTQQSDALWGEIDLTPEESAWLAQGYTVRVRVGPAPPLMFSDGQVRGIAIDYLETIFNRQGIAYEYVTENDVSWPQALDYIRNHETVDMVPTINRTTEREDYIAFTRDYLFYPRVIFTRDDADFVATIDDLSGKTVSVEDGFVTQTLIEQQFPDVHLVKMSGNDPTGDALAALASGQVDAYVGNLAIAAYLIETKGFSNIKVAAPSPFPDHNQAMGIRDDWPELASIIDKSLDAMPPETSSAIRNRWLSVRYEYGIHFFDVIKWIAAIVAVALVILSIILYWNRRLQQELAERTRIEGELHESERRFRDMLENLNLIAVMLDTKGNITFCNDFLLDLTDWTREEILGKNWFDLFIPPELDIKKIFIEAISQQGFPVHAENDILTRSKDRRLILWNNTVLRDSNGEIIGTASIGQDITNRKLAELTQQSYAVQLEEVVRERTEELEEAQEELIRKEKLATLGQLAGSVGHELRNPLSVISNAIYFLKMLHSSADETTREYLGIINTEVSKSEKIISDLLNFSRTGLTAHVEKERVEVSALVASALEEHPPKESVTASVHLPANLPPVFVDSQQINQVLVNLITNACQAMSEKGTLTIEAKEKGEDVLLSVTDTGCGIAAENMQKLFEPLFTTKAKGIGLGLAVSRNLVEANGGRIEVKSKVGQGTTFILTLPVTESSG